MSPRRASTRWRCSTPGTPRSRRSLGRIPTGWYPTAVELSRDGKFLYVANAKGIAEDLSPSGAPAPPSKVMGTAGSLVKVDSNYIFGSVQKVDLASTRPDNRAVLANNFVVAPPVDTRVVPAGGAASRKIKHVFFILHENKTFDSMLGNMPQFGPFASLTYTDSSGATFTDAQYTRRVEEPAGARGEVRGRRQLLQRRRGERRRPPVRGVGDRQRLHREDARATRPGAACWSNKNMDAEDYPESGYIFNNAARHGVSFKDYGDLIRIVGTDTGASAPTTLNDPLSGKAGYPALPVTTPVHEPGRRGLGDRGGSASRTS